MVYLCRIDSSTVASLTDYILTHHNLLTVCASQRRFVYILSTEAIVCIDSIDQLWISSELELDFVFSALHLYPN